MVHITAQPADQTPGVIFARGREDDAPHIDQAGLAASNGHTD